MTSYTRRQVRDAAISYFKAQIPQLATVSPWGGRFDFQEVMQKSFKAPALWITVLGTRNVKLNSHDTDKIGDFAAFLIVVNTVAVDLHDLALDLVDEIENKLTGQAFGLDIDLPKNIESRNLYRGDIKSRAVALWSTTWQQPYTSQAGQLTGLYPLNKVHTDWYLGGEGISSPPEVPYEGGGEQRAPDATTEIDPST